MNYQRIPRKSKKQIPKGHYCYKGLRYDRSTGIYHIKPCIFYTNIKIKDKPEHMQDEIDKRYPNDIIGWCKLLKCDIDDQCKFCGIKI